MAASIRAFDELAEFFASKVPDDLIAFQPSKATSDRVELLIFKKKRDGLTAYMVLERIMRLAKDKARENLDCAMYG